MPLSIEAKISDTAARMAAYEQRRATDLRLQITEVEHMKTKLLADLDLARRAGERLTDFKVKVGIDYQCPRCWIENETRSALAPIGGGTRTEDFFRCHTCGLEFSVAV
jgi:transposase-like protein